MSRHAAVTAIFTFAMWFASLGAIVLAFPVSSANAAQTDRKPNVILILTDDQGYGEVAAHGNPIIKTPNMDELYAAKIQTVIGDRQSVAVVRLQQVRRGYAEVTKDNAVIVGMFQCIQAVPFEVKVVVLMIGQIDDEQHGGHRL